MLRIALTGGIASGKSAAAAAFRVLGVPVVDADQVARDVVEPGAAGLEALVREFGRAILDDEGRLDRNRMRQAVFSDESTRQRINALLHPLILKGIEERLSGIRAPYAIVEVPLLAESGAQSAFDRVLVIDVPESVQRERLQRRDAAGAQETEAALAAQATREQRLALADDVIENTGTLAGLREAVESLHDRYLTLAKSFATAGNRPAE